MKIFKFLGMFVKYFFRGGYAFYAWLAILLALIFFGVVAYFNQLQSGLILTNMRDQVSWGFYIGNFAFLVGVAAAAVLLVIPAYIYNWGPIKEVAVYGEILAICAVSMCLLFVIVDICRPDRFWHLFPFIGNLNFPGSLLAWDVLVLNGYFALNVFIVGYLLYCEFYMIEINKALIYPLIIFSIPMAISIHTVTAYLFNGLSARPFWNSAILTPRFLCSAFCSGPAILLLLFQILQKISSFKIKDEAIFKIAELMAYCMFINLFLLAAEVFKEYYSDSHHVIHLRYLFSGIGDKTSLVPYAWVSVTFSVAAFFLFLFKQTRENYFTLNIGCFFIYFGIYFEKGMGLIVPGFTPTTLGEVYVYVPTKTEVTVGAGIFAIGFLLFTLLCKITMGIYSGELSPEGLDRPVENQPDALPA